MALTRHSGRARIITAMDPELTLPQAREIARLRRRYPGAAVHVHQRPWGLVVEVRRGDRVVELERFDWSGAVLADQRIDRAA